jgi:competence protein ComEC
VLHKEIPFLRLGLPLCIGIVSGLYLKPGNLVLISVSVVILICFLISLYYNIFQTNQFFGCALTLSLILCGFLLYKHEKNSISVLKPEQTTFYCVVSDYPEVKENSITLKVKLEKRILNERVEPAEGSMVLYNRKDSSVTSLLPGDLLVIKCTPLEIVNRGNPFEFDYRFYMENQGIRYYAFANKNNILAYKVPDHRKLVHRALILRERLIEMFRERGISGDRLALVAAITLGQKNMLDQDQKQAFIKAGVMHIMAVSGLHAVILSLIVFNLLFFLKKRFNVMRILITILILWAFTYITGLTPSVLRATLMFSFLQAGNLIKRRVNGINSVLASAFLLILIRPSVIFDAGFLLSYLAVIYIICFYQDFYLKLKVKNWFVDKLGQSAAVTIVAQEGTLPLTVMLFNRFPTYFILTNILIVPLSNLLIILGSLVLLLFPVQFLSHFLASVLSWLTGLTEFLTARASALPMANIENIGMTTVECILFSATIFAFTIFFLKKQSFPIKYPLILLILFVAAGTFREISTRTSNELIVYNTPGLSTIGIRTGKILTLYSGTSFVGPEVLRHCATLGLKIRGPRLIDNPVCTILGEKKILISNTLNSYMLNNILPDMIIITGSRPEVAKNLSFNNTEETLVVTARATSGYRTPYKSGSSGIDSVHLVRKAGAFQMSI